MQSQAHPQVDSATRRQEPSTEEALRLQNARLAALHKVTFDLTSTLDLEDVLQRVVEMAQQLSESAHAHIFLYNAEDDSLNFAASHWSSAQRVVPLHPRRAGVTYLVAHTGKPEFIEDTSMHSAYTHEPADRKPGALACLPLIKGDRILGTLNLGYWEPHSFDPDTREFLDLIARHVALAIENARLYQVAIEKAQLEHELEVARELQISMIPRETPQLAGWEFATLWKPAHIVSGDFYDFVQVGGTRRQGIVIADVSDKGMPAALFMAVARSTIRASISSECCPEDSLNHANRFLAADSVNGMFVTACYAEIDPETGALIYVNAGHNPPLLYRAAQNEFFQLARTGIALGVDDKQELKQDGLSLESGDFVLLYTDGVVEAANECEEELGTKSLRDILFARRNAHAGEIIAWLQESLADFVGNTPPFDDITAVVVKRTSQKKTRAHS